MSFEIKGKIALISGGASGLGLKYAIELLRNDLKGITLADVNEEYGKNALEEIEKKFGKNKAIFVLADVTNKSNYEDAFKKTVETYGNLDILINNAGILNDYTWEKEISINLCGTINGTLLGLNEYIPKNKSGPEGVIVNISSIAGVSPSILFPIYSATKFGVLGMSLSLGEKNYYNTTKVKVLVLCPGLTKTPMITNMPQQTTLGPYHQNVLDEHLAVIPKQNPNSVATAMVDIIKNASTGTVWVAENDKKPYEYILPPRSQFAPT